MLPAIALIIAAAPCGGCGDPSFQYHGPVKWPYEDLLAVCATGDTVPDRSFLTPAGDLWGVAPECADAVGETFEIDWDSFGEEPDSFTDATTPAELVVAGFLAVLGHQDIAVDETTRDGAPEVLLTRFDDLQSKYGFAESQDAGALWYQLLTAEIDQVVYNPEIEAIMSYGAGRVNVGDITDALDPPGSPAQSFTIVEVAGFLIHEAAHGLHGGHIECGEAAGPFLDEDSNCDANAEGAYGVQAWWLYDWTRSNGKWLEEGVCWGSTRALADACMCIIERDDYEACNGWDTIECEGPE